jgi:hypothetical protein
MKKDINNTLVKLWKNRLNNIPCFIIGNSPTLNNFNLDVISKYFTIGINRAFFKIDPSVIFWQDKELWITEKNKLLKSTSFRVCHYRGDPYRKFLHFEINGSHFMRSEDPSVLHGRGSTGPLAVQFAKALGCNPIYGIGMDCSVINGQTDFYGINKTWKDHTVNLCSRGLQWIDKEYKNGEFINISNNPKMLDTIVEKFKIHSRGKEFYKNLLLGSNPLKKD